MTAVFPSIATLDPKLDSLDASLANNLLSPISKESEHVGAADGLGDGAGVDAMVDGAEVDAMVDGTGTKAMVDGAGAEVRVDGARVNGTQ
mmetsp:Transcript_57151/g.66808  ORF Transcript_57151/g.66808 Transcript_57151/m.66808 type:complete len:90 (+) Transcript_57151:1063-1332(+)